MAEIEELSPGTEAGAGTENPQQAADPQAQAPGQGQSPESAPVDSGESAASSKVPPARNNSQWANQRVLEKTIGKLLSSALDERLSPLIERLNGAAPSPQGDKPAENLIDYNDLGGSITKLVEKALEARLTNAIPRIKDELQGDLSSKSKLQEARKYLTSHPDIGQDQAKHEQIRDIIANDVLLYNSVEKYPQEVMETAVRRWRESRTNPNVPGKGELSTVTGGSAMGQRKGEPSMQKIRELQNKVISSNLPIEERNKLNSEIDALMAVLK